MAFALDDETDEIHIPFKTKKKKAREIVLIIQYLTCRQVRKFTADSLVAARESDNEKHIAAVIELLKTAMCGFKVGETQYPIEEIEDFLTDNEMWTLIWKFPSLISASEMDKKKLPSPSQSSGAGSVPTATTVDANATPAPSST